MGTTDKLNSKIMGFRSDEEMYFMLWMEELVEAGYIKHYDYENDYWELSGQESYKYREVLKTKTNIKERVLLNPHEYGCDFTITWEPKAHTIFYQCIGEEYDNKDIPFHADCGSNKSYVEVKPQFDRNNMTRAFSINQKWVYSKYGVLVNMIQPTDKKTCLFATTFTPDRYLLTNVSLEKRKIKHEVRTLEQFLNSFK